MKVYSPTQTNEFAFCPQARQFYKEGWVPLGLRNDMSSKEDITDVR